MEEKREKHEPPVQTGHDARCRERAAQPKTKKTLPAEPNAPDGISGDWG